MKTRRLHIPGTSGPVASFTLCGLRMNRQNQTAPTGEVTCRACRTLDDPRPVSLAAKRLAAKAASRVAGVKP